MRCLTLNIAICLLFTSFVHAQENAAAYKQAKIDMIREAVIFYSTDPEISKRKVECDAVDITGLKECARAMKKVDQRIDDWNKMVVNDEAGLLALGARILTDVTGGKKYREKLPSYAAFKKSLENPDIVRTSPPPAEAEVTEDVPIVSAKPGPALGSLPADPAPDKTNGNVLRSKDTEAQENKPLWENSLVISLAALAIAIVALILALLKRRRRSQRRSGSRQGMQQGFGEPETYSAESGIAALRQQVAELDRELGKVTVRFEESEQSLAARIQRLESQQTIVRPDRDQSNTAAPYAATKKWAKSVDSGGFGIDALAADPDDKMIYEITQTGRDTATFKVSDARDAQLFALSNPQNYLREGCTYTTQPSLNSQIRTDVPGTLELQGRKWRIVKQAQIAFV